MRQNLFTEMKSSPTIIIFGFQIGTIVNQIFTYLKVSILANLKLKNENISTVFLVIGCISWPWCNAVLSRMLAASRLAPFKIRYFAASKCPYSHAFFLNYNYSLKIQKLIQIIFYQNKEEMNHHHFWLQYQHQIQSTAQ